MYALKSEISAFKDIFVSLTHAHLKLIFEEKRKRN